MGWAVFVFTCSFWPTCQIMIVNYIHRNREIVFSFSFMLHRFSIREFGILSVDAACIFMRTRLGSVSFGLGNGVGLRRLDTQLGFVIVFISYFYR